MNTTLLTAMIVLAVASTPAFGQGGAELPEAYVSFGGLYHTRTWSFHDSFTFQEFAEDGRVDSDYRVEKVGTFDVSGTVRLWRSLYADVAFSQFSTSSPSSIVASIPHPFFFGRDRQVAGAVPSTHTERALHIGGTWVIPIATRILIAPIAGASLIVLEQDIATRVNYSHTYPYDTASFESVSIENRIEKAPGFNVGANVTYLFTEHLGVGALIRYSSARVKLKPDLEVDAGGPQVGAGVRLAF